MRTTPWNDRGLLLIRLALGLVFVMHGWQKLAVYGLSGVTGSMAQLGLPLPALSATLITATELLGGLALLAGAGTRVASGLLAFSMGVAVLAVHLPAGFFAPAGVEYPMTLALVALGLASTGAGRYSLDALVSSRRAPVQPASYRRAA